jgi:hypothetical protein
LGDKANASAARRATKPSRRPRPPMSWIRRAA